MTKFDMGAAWDDSIALLKSHSALTGTIAAVFLFLPALAVAWFGPTPIEPPANADFNQIISNFQQNIRQMLPYQLIAGLLAVVGTIGILRLWLSRTGTSVGEALAFAATMFLTAVVAQILVGLALGVGFLLLIIPCFYLVGRFALVAPVIADRGVRNPIEAIRTSWDLTRNNGWAIFFFIFLVTIVILVIALVIGVVLAVVAGSGTDFGRMLSGGVEAAFGAIGSLVSTAIVAAAYRQLAVQGSPDVFQ